MNAVSRKKLDLIQDANIGDLLITRGNEFLTIYRYRFGSAFPIRCMRHKNNLGLCVDLTRDGRYYYTEHILSKWDVIEHIPAKSPISYFELYEKLRTH